MQIIKSLDNFYQLQDQSWSGAVETLETIAEHGKQAELMDLLDELYPDPVEEVALNDLLWHESEWVFEQLGIEE